MAISVPVLGLKSVLGEVVRTKTGFFGFGMLVVLLALVLAVPLVAPFDVVREWSNREAWLDNPRVAAPEWSELFAGRTLPRTVIVHPCFTATTVPLSINNTREKCPGGQWGRLAVRTTQFGNYTFITMDHTFDFVADVFPSEISMIIWANYGPEAPLVEVTLRRPDNVNFSLFSDAPEQRTPAANRYPLSTDQGLKDRVKAWASVNYSATSVDLIRPEVTLFANAGPDMLDTHKATVLKGKYVLRIQASAHGYVGMDAKAVIYGTVFGLAGTDTHRRDLVIGLLWGAPVALAFGVVAAVVIVLLQTILGALATWYGGWWDEIIQRAADVFLIIPLLPILLLIAIVYSPSIWTTLGILVLFGVVGSTTKVARSIVLQVKEEAYIESAISYGASRARILFKHILPRLMPYTFALIALSVPAFIFLEASLSFLGLGDPLLPTWGAILGQAYTDNALFHGLWWWIAFPAGGIIFATVAFSLLGYSFDKVLNPRLREQ